MLIEIFLSYKEWRGLDYIFIHSAKEVYVILFISKVVYYHLSFQKIDEFFLSHKTKTLKLSTKIKEYKKLKIKNLLLPQTTFFFFFIS